MRRGHVSVTVLIVHYSLDVRALFSSQETEIVHTCEVLIETFDAVMTEANTFQSVPGFRRLKIRANGTAGGHICGFRSLGAHPAQATGGGRGSEAQLVLVCGRAANCVSS